MKYLNKFMIRENKLSAYTDVWVIIKYGDTDINEIYLKKDEAELDCIKRNEELKKIRYNANSKYEVRSLDGAIDMIKDSVKDNERENFASHNDESF
jgi:hypothetical protein